MQKKILVGIIVLVVIIGGAYAIFHKSTPSTSSNTTPPAASSQNSKSPTSTTAAIIQTKTASNVGQYLADSTGNALYTYGGDTNDVSNCNNSCIYSWPVYAPTTSSETLPTNVTIITRSDGTKQYAYKGMPLYTFTGDSSGQVTGNGVSDFQVAKP